MFNMGSLNNIGWCVSVCVLCFCFSFISGVKDKVPVIEGTVSIDGKVAIASTDENFICATMDMWPPTKCDYGVCPWGNAGFLNVDFNNKILNNAVKEFAPLRLRLGGTLQDRLVYQTDRKKPCTAKFVPNASELLGFTEACMSLDRWDEINAFINRTGAETVFGVNILTGKTIEPNHTTGIAVATGDWDSTNTLALIKYTVKKGYKIRSWGIGNELGGLPLFIHIPPGPYAKDTIAFHRSLAEIYKGVNFKPTTLSPAGIYEHSWYKRYIHKTPGYLDIITHHIYNLGSGNDDDLVDKILDPPYLDEISESFKGLRDILKSANSKTVAWVGESGGAYNSGKDGVSNAFVNSFWYLDIQGMASTYDTKAFCRQTLIGGNYGLLDTTTFVPNPDYYSALLWHRLMGRKVLSTKFEATKYIRAYTHCAKKSSGITILLINLDGNNTVKAKLDFKAYGTAREEYHLTPKDGNILSRTVLLNGRALTLDSNGAIPALKPVLRLNSASPVIVAPHSIVFVHLPHASLPAC